MFTAFDQAYKKSFEMKKNFALNGNYINNILNSDENLKRGFDQAENGKEQTKFAAIIALNGDSDLFKMFRSLKPRDYKLQQIYDAGNRERSQQADNILNGSLSVNPDDPEDEV